MGGLRDIVLISPRRPGVVVHKELYDKAIFEE